MLPTTQVRRPAFLKISPSKVEVVVLPLVPVTARERAGGFAVGVFQFAHHLHAQFAGAKHGGVRIRDAGAYDERVHALDERQRVFHAQLPANAGHVEVVQRARELLAGLYIADSHFAAAREQQPCRRRAAARHTQHQRFLNLHIVLLFEWMYPRKGAARADRAPFARTHPRP